MYEPVRRPDEILAYRTLRQLLVAKPAGLWTITPNDNIIAALRIMADKDIGFLVVMDKGALVGVVSERDCVRRAVLPGKPVAATPIAEIMTREVVSVEANQTFADCLRLMHQHGIRHLTVLDAGKLIAVVSIRDLLREAVTHNAKIISELELERMTMFTSMA